MMRQIPVMQCEYAKEGEDIRQILNHSLRLYICRTLETSFHKAEEQL